MSQRNILGSEAFDRTPFVIIRQVRAGGMRRRRTRTAMAFVAGVAATAAAGLIAAAAILGPALTT